jgi:hypothetical protein
MTNTSDALPGSFNSQTGAPSSQAPLSGSIDSNSLSIGLTPPFNFGLAGLGPLPFEVAQSAKPRKKKAGERTRQAKQLPPLLDMDGCASNALFQQALIDDRLVFAPQELGFLPSNYWLDHQVTFGDLVTKFFQRKNNANCRFPHKLYNALTIVAQDPAKYSLLGVSWITDRIFKVDKLIFGRLLGITAIDGGLFHHQGNFPSHGFVELGVADANIEDLALVTDVDRDRVRLFIHSGDMFHKDADEASVTMCRWLTETEPTQ